MDLVFHVTVPLLRCSLRDYVSFRNKRKSGW